MHIFTYLLIIILTTRVSCLLETTRNKKNALKDFLVRVGIWPAESEWINLAEKGGKNNSLIY